MDNYSLNVDQRDQIKAKLIDYLPFECRICGNEMNNITNYTGKLISTNIDDQKTVNLDTVNFICDNCGHLEIFSAASLGLKF